MKRFFCLKIKNLMTDVKQKIHVGYYNGFLKIVTDVGCQIDGSQE